MLSYDLEVLHALFAPYRNAGMQLDSDAIVNVCDAIEAMTRQAWELEAGGRGKLPDGVTVLSLEALQRRTIPDVLRLNTYEDGAGDPDPGDAA